MNVDAAREMLGWFSVWSCPLSPCMMSISCSGVNTAIPLYYSVYLWMLMLLVKCRDDFQFDRVFGRPYDVHQLFWCKHRDSIVIIIVFTCECWCCSWNVGMIFSLIVSSVARMMSISCSGVNTAIPLASLITSPTCNMPVKCDNLYGENNSSSTLNHYPLKIKISDHLITYTMHRMRETLA